MAASPSPPLDPNLPDNRGNYKLKAASRHLDNLRQIEATAGSLVSSNDRMHAEMEIDEFLYQLIGVKDALLQEINCELHLGFTLEEVRIETVNNELNQKRPIASDMTKEICYFKQSPPKAHSLVTSLRQSFKLITYLKGFMQTVELPGPYVGLCSV